MSGSGKSGILQAVTYFYIEAHVLKFTYAHVYEVV